MGEPADWSSWWAAWKRLNRQDPVEYSDALVAMSWSAGTRSNYAVHIRALGTLAATQPKVDKSKLLDRYLRALFAKGTSRSYMRGGISAVRAWEDLGWIGGMVQARHWRMSKSTIRNTEEQRRYGGLEALSVLAQSYRTKEQWSGFALAVLSFTCLLRVGKAAGVRRRGIEDEAIWFRCNKNGDKVVQRELGPYSAKWARWLRDYGSTGRRRSPIMCPSGSPWLESFLEYGFRRTEYASHRWHCWKRGGGALQKYLALPAEIRQWWGRWRSRSVPKHYAQPPEEYKIWTSIKLPWPEGPSKFVKRTTRGQDFWPTALLELFRDGQQTAEQQPNVGSKRACIVLSDDDTPQRPRVQVRRTVKVRRDGGCQPRGIGGFGASRWPSGSCSKYGTEQFGSGAAGSGKQSTSSQVAEAMMVGSWGGCWCRCSGCGGIHRSWVYHTRECISVSFLCSSRGTRGWLG